MAEKSLVLAEREGFSLSSPKLNVFNGFELTPDCHVYQWRVLKSSSPPRVSAVRRVPAQGLIADNLQLSLQVRLVLSPPRGGADRAGRGAEGLFVG